MNNRLSLFAKIFLGIIVVGVNFLNISKVDAATMSLNSSVTKVIEGATFVVNVSINTQSKIINNAEAVVSYPADVVEVTSIGYGSSIFTLWAEVPVFSNTTGMVSFNGGIPNPGFTGSGGVMSITFKAKKIGEASITISNAAIRENDGLGTNIFSGKKNMNIEVVAKSVEPPKEEVVQPTKPTPPVVPTSTPGTVVTSTEDVLPSEEYKAPEITYHSGSIEVGQQIEIQGKTKDSESTISIIVKSEYGKIFNYDVTPDEEGNFTFLSEPMITDGAFEAYVYSTNLKGEKSPVSQKIRIEVRPVITEKDLSALNIPVLPALAIGIIMLLVVLNIFSLYKIHSLKRQYGYVEQKSRKMFKLLLSRASKQIEALEKTKKSGSITVRGQAALKELKDTIEHLGDFDEPDS